MSHPVLASVLIASIALPAATAALTAFAVFLAGVRSEALVRRAAIASLCASVAGNAGIAAFGRVGTLDLGNFVQVGSYSIPGVFVVDGLAVAFAALAAVLTLLVAIFSSTYLHKELGFARFFILLGLFASGTQMVAYAGALDLVFLGWELVGITSALFIGFFHERAEPMRSSLRAFATYRLCDAGFLLGVVATHELIGSTRIDALGRAHALTDAQSGLLAVLFLVAACGKSAQLPFSGWLARALEGPTPTSALFYGGVSIHLGLYFMLRAWPVLGASPAIAALGAAIGLATSVYAAAVARTATDAKGALAHATLAQVGLILAEISLGFTTLALVHLVGHALLRVWQYLRTPNAVHDAHRLALSHAHADAGPTPLLAHRFYAAALHRFRIDDRVDAVVRPLLHLARVLNAADARVRRAADSVADTASVRGER